jgi:soluble lytic murein transglycosylase-like protein
MQKEIVQGTGKALLVIACVSLVAGAAIGMVYVAKKYAVPVVCSSPKAVPLARYEEAGDKLASFGEYSGQCFQYVEKAAALLPPTGSRDPSPKAILAALIAQESSGNPRAISPTGAKGCGQIVLKYHPHMKNYVWNPEKNVQYAAKFLSELVKKHGTYWAAIPHYNGCVPSNDCISYRNEVFALARKYGK